MEMADKPWEKRSAADLWLLEVFRLAVPLLPLLQVLADGLQLVLHYVHNGHPLVLLDQRNVGLSRAWWWKTGGVGLERHQQTVEPFTAVNFRLFVYVKPYHMCVAQKGFPSSPRGEGGPTYSMCRYVLLGHVYDLYTLYELQPLVLILSAELGTKPPQP